MSKFLVLKELRARPWQSVLQLTLGGIAIYILTITVGPEAACGNGMVDSVFACHNGAMAFTAKAKIVAGIGLAALCWGRAMSLLEQRSKAAERAGKNRNEDR